MNSRYYRSLRKVFAGVVAAAALVALGGCFPYYYDPGYGYGHGHYERSHHGGWHNHDRDDHHRRRDHDGWWR
ncbi:MAG: hypothetical protein WB783_21020 [Arenicellales bacterium]